MPIDMSKVTKLVNELYISSIAKHYLVAMLYFYILTTSYDVNVAPDKRKKSSHPRLHFCDLLV
jgi:DNA mismatch repair protein PMS2